MKLAEMTYRQVETYLERDWRLILPVGACVQHGAHLPLGNGIYTVERLADFLSEDTGIPVAPTINYGIIPPCDRAMAGTAGIEFRALRDTAGSALSWWRSQGFSQFFLLTCHNDPFHLDALRGLGPDARLVEPFAIDCADVLEAQETRRHACEAETSVALYLHPDRVDMAAVEEGDVPPLQFADYMYHRRGDRPRGYTGALGAPSAATAEKGRILVERMRRKMLLDVEGA